MSEEDVREENEFLERFHRDVLGADYEKELGVLTEKRELMDVDTLVRHAETKHKLELPTLGCHVYYKPLRIGDRITVNEVKHPDPDVQRDMRNRTKVYLLLSRADPRYTMEVIEALPAQVVDTILTEHLSQEEEGFLLPLLRRRSLGFSVLRGSRSSSS